MNVRSDLALAYHIGYEDALAKRMPDSSRAGVLNSYNCTNDCTNSERTETCEADETDTWERIIEDAIGEGMARQRNNDSGNFCERANPMNNGDLVARCKALCERTKEEDE